jgi:hypothetical protein
MSELERGVLRVRLGRDEEGDRMHPLPPGHTFRAEQDALGHYALPGWEQKWGLPRYSSFEHEDGRSRTSEEFKCATGQRVGEWDAANVPGLVKGGSKSAKKSMRPHRSRGAFVFCCPHRVISGFHFFLRGESPRDAFAVLYTRKDREDLPKYVMYDNACQLRNYLHAPRAGVLLRRHIRCGQVGVGSTKTSAPAGPFMCRLSHSSKG